MSSAKQRLSKIASHFEPLGASQSQVWSTSNDRSTHFHHLSPTFFLPRAASIEPEAVAIRHRSANDRDLARTYAEFAKRASGFGYYLRSNGYRRVGILCPNTPAFLEAVYGISAAGAVIVAINHRLHTNEIAYIFQHSDVDLILVDAEFEHLLRSYTESRPNVTLLVDDDFVGSSSTLPGSYQSAVEQGLQYDKSKGGQAWSGLETEASDENGVIALAYTSGTTARPKGVECTHRGVYMAAVANVIESGLNINNGRCRYLWTLPMFHAMGWTFPWAVTMVRGTHYCLRKIDYGRIWRLLKEEHITHFSAAPTVNTLLCHAESASRLPQPVSVTVAASPPTPSLFEQMTSLNLHPVHTYGMTETYGPITKSYYLPNWDNLPKAERFRNMARQGHGFATSLPVRVVRMDPSDDAMVDVQPNGKDIGEIVFKGNICAKGYYKDSEATRKLFAGGVLHSGDLAVVHPDGAIQIQDRAKDIIISGGENISSVALESVFGSHPDIIEVGVVAVKDDQWGERPKAFVTAKPDRQVRSSDLIDWAREKGGLSGFMLPIEIETVSQLPKTSTGKIQKNVLREWTASSHRNPHQGS